MIAVNSARPRCSEVQRRLLQLPLPYVIEDWPEYAWGA